VSAFSVVDGSILAYHAAVASWFSVAGGSDPGRFPVVGEAITAEIV
jgi:hypothetical protein